MATFEKRPGAPTGDIKVSTALNSYTFQDGGSVSVTSGDDIATLLNHPYVRLQGGTGGPYVSPPVIDHVFLKDGVLVKAGDGSPVTVGAVPLAPDWQPNTPYVANQLVRAPDLTLVRRIAPGTSGATYDSTQWVVIAGNQALGSYVETRTPQSGITTTRTALTGLILPTFTINAGDPAWWVESWVPYWTFTAINGRAAHNLVRNEDASLHGTTFSSDAFAANQQGCGTRAIERFTAPGQYTMAAQATLGGTGTMTANAAANAPAYIRAWREV